MSAVILIRSGKYYYEVRVNPARMTSLELGRYARLMAQYIAASKAGRLARMITIERRIQKIEKIRRINPARRRRAK